MLKTVAIYNRNTKEEVLDRLISEFSRLGVEVLLYQRPEDTYNNDDKLVKRFTDLSMLPALPEIALSVGGDGTFLETAMNVKDTGIPIAGINTGRMGFLANISADDIEQSIEMLVNNDYTIVERCCLKLEKPAYLFSGNEVTALNEITIQKVGLSMITIKVEVDDKYLNTYWSDGLIISTATGSTAYNLSSGGPILTPDDTNIIISPMSPHNLTVRPIVLSGQSKLKLTIEGRSQEFMTTCDFRSKQVPVSEEIHISMDNVKLKTVMLKGMDFYSTLRNKLMWGLDRRN
jgi:NAD+ kinase